MDVDHVYICTRDVEAHSALLRELGLVEGEPNVHPGQGTANRRFFFRNGMLELLYVRDVEELRSERTQILGLYDQFYGEKCGIGIVLRPSEGEGRAVPYEARQYRPLYLPDGLHMDVSRGEYTTEPRFIFLGFPDGHRNAIPAEQRISGCPIDSVSGYRVHTTRDDLSGTAEIVRKRTGIRFTKGEHPLIEVEFNGGARGAGRCLFPELPLILRW
jgi:hypothetical protein